MPGHQPLQPGLEIRANGGGILYKSKVFNHIEHGHPGRTGYVIAAKGTEKCGVADERLVNLGPCDDDPDGVAVACGFADGDDIGDNAVVLKPPERCAHPAKPGLHLVRDAQPACGADPIKYSRHIAWLRFQHAVGHEGRIADIGGGFQPGLRQ